MSLLHPATNWSCRAVASVSAGLFPPLPAQRQSVRQNALQCFVFAKMLIIYTWAASTEGWAPFRSPLGCEKSSSVDFRTKAESSLLLNPPPKFPIIPLLVCSVERLLWPWEATIVSALNLIILHLKSCLQAVVFGCSFGFIARIIEDYYG